VNIGVDLSKLKKSPQDAQVVGGTQEVYILPDVTFLFIEDKTEEPIYVHLKEIDVIPPPSDMKKDESILTKSLMGVDLLKKFHFDYRMPHAILEY